MPDRRAESRIELLWHGTGIGLACIPPLAPPGRFSVVLCQSQTIPLAPPPPPGRFSVVRTVSPRLVVSGSDSIAGFADGSSGSLQVRDALPKTEPQPAQPAAPLAKTVKTEKENRRTGAY